MPTTCSPASGATFAIGTTTVTCSAHDTHSNTASASFTVTVSDTTAPVIAVPANMTVPATGPSGAIVTYSATATDGVDGAVVTSCAPASGSTFAVGTTTVSCTATDAHNNTATKSFQVQVQVQIQGSFFLQPINSDGSSIFKLGKTLPLKFQLTGASAGITNLVANLSVAKLTSSVLGTVTEAVTNSQADAGSTFRYDSTSGQYIYNLSTDGLSTGTWQLRIDVHGARRGACIVKPSGFWMARAENGRSRRTQLSDLKYGGD